jgi:hypothetical protein
MRAYYRQEDGTEVEIGNAQTGLISSNSALLYSTNFTIGSDIAIVTTDRIVVKIFATNSSSSARTVRFHYAGSTNVSHMLTSLRVVGEAGPTGPTGPTGPQGDAGDTGATGPTGPA